MRHRPEGPGLLPGAPDGTAPLLGQAGIVQQEQAVWRTLGHSGGHALLVESLGLPGCIRQYMLSAFSRAARHRRGDGVAVLPLQVREQPCEGALHARPAGRATAQWREGFPGGGQLWQRVRTGFGDNRRVHKGYNNFMR